MYQYLPVGKYYIYNDVETYKDIVKDDNTTIQHVENVDVKNIFYNINWIRYRLGDTFYLRGGNSHAENYPGSIAMKLKRKQKDNLRDYHNNKYCILNTIIQDIPIYTHNSKDFLYIGLRIGDVLEEKTHIKNSSYWTYNSDEYLSMNMEEYANKIVILVCGAHTIHNFKNTMLYLQSVNDVFVKKGFSRVLFRIGNSPDDDFVLLSRAENLIAGKGGFHMLAKEMNDKYVTK